MTPTARPFHLSDASIRVDSMPTAGRDLTLRVDADKRATLASELDVSAVNALEVKLQAVRFRGRAEQDMMNPGFGIGLAIAKGIVERHGGEIALRNRAEGGALFEIALPLRAGTR